MSLRYRNVLPSLNRFLPETQAIIDRAVLEGFTLPSPATLSYINTLISVMIADGYWTKRDLILNFAYNDLICRDFSRINWKNPSGALMTRVGFTNLISGSEIFDGNGWSKVSSASVTDNVTTAPDSTMTGAKYWGGASTSRIQRVTTTILPGTVNIPVVLSLYAKAEVMDNLRLTDGISIANYNLTSGVATLLSGVGSASMTSVGGGWWRCILTIPTWATSSIQIYTEPRFNGTDGIYIWGAQLNEGTVAATYVKTTATSNSGEVVYTPHGWKGYQGNTTNVFLNTNFSLISDSPQYTTTNAGRDLIVQELGFNNSYLDGNNSFGDSLRAGNFNTQRIASGNNALNTLVGLAVTGYISINRTSSTNVELFTGPTQFSRTQTNGSISTGTQTLHKGAFLAGSSNMSYYSIGAEVVTEGQLLRTAYNNYLTNIGLPTFA